METVDVIIDVPLDNNNSVYTYSVPQFLQDSVAYGKRVMVEFGNRRCEAFIIKCNDSSQPEEDLKPVLQVLDQVPVLDQQIYELAVWVAKQYICPVSKVLKAMLPPALKKKRGAMVSPLCSQEVFQQKAPHIPENFVDQLYQNGEIKIKDAFRIVDKEAINWMQDNSLIAVGRTYTPGIHYGNNLVYKIDRFNPEDDMPHLNKKAPKQAEIMTYLMEKGELNKKDCDRTYSRSSIQALISRKFICIARKKIGIIGTPLKLNPEQQQALETIDELLDKGIGSEALLYGITASGKTEVYLQAIDRCLNRKKRAMVLVPEIALTRHLLAEFYDRFGDIAVLHSRMTPGERFDQWNRIKQGKVDIVLGTRSAVFAPIKNLGLIIIDEEHEPGYKQEENPKYHAGEVAQKLAKYFGAVLVYGSATPSLEIFYRAMQGEVKLLTLTRRTGKYSHPDIAVFDMSTRKKGEYILSDLLIEEMIKTFKRGEQSIIFLNRRGYAPYLICRNCGKVALCPECSIAMNFHNDKGENICHYCNYHERFTGICSYCGSKSVQLNGFGTQKVEEDIKRIIPEARVERLDLDSSRVKGEQLRILKEMKAKTIDILVGTQMVAKGFDFPGVSLVGIIDADSMINIPDYRAGERAFQLMVQVSGRAGRADCAGKVIIQTFNPSNEIVAYASRQDYLGFYGHEIKNRSVLNYPPFTNIMRFTVSEKDEGHAREYIMTVYEELLELLDAREDSLDILGPSPSPIARLKSRYRYQIMIKCNNIILLRSIGERLLYITRGKNIAVSIDINPLF